jgi:hypothetical protein
MSKRKRRTEIKPPGKCIFCEGGAVPGNPMSGEHLWSDWMSDILPGDPGIHHFEFFETKQRKNTTGERFERIRQGSANTKRIKVVCRECNNGWMSVLESEAKPFLKPLILGQPSLLGLSARKTLSEWFVLKALVAEHNAVKSSAADPIFEQEARDRFKSHREIPFGCRIWLCMHNGLKWSCAYSGHSAGILPSGESPMPSPRRPNVYAATFGLGALLGYVFATTSSELNDRIKFNGFVPPLRILWPVADADIRWPPLHVLGDADGDRIANNVQALIDSSVAMEE